MSWKDIFTTITKYFTGEILLEAKHMIQDTIDTTTRKVIKASILYLLFALGVLFMLIGTAQFITEYYVFIAGTGYLLVGFVLVFLGLLIKALR